MDNDELLAYKNRLLDAGIAWRKAKRNVREIHDHFHDLKRQAQDSGLNETFAKQLAREQLGELDQLADAMITGNARSLLHRHPVAMTVVLPFMAYIVVCVLLVAVLMLVVDLPALSQEGQTSVMPLWLEPFFNIVFTVQIWLLTPLLAVWLIVISIRNRILPRYWLSGVLLLCLFGSGATMSAAMPDPATGREGSLGLSFGYGIFHPALFKLYDSNNLRLLLNLFLCGLFAVYYVRLHSANAVIIETGKCEHAQ